MAEVKWREAIFVEVTMKSSGKPERLNRSCISKIEPLSGGGSRVEMALFGTPIVLDVIENTECLRELN